MEKIIEINEDIQIGNLLLEKGDKIKIYPIQEATSSVTDLLIDQYNLELESALTYQGLMNSALFNGYEGMAHYFKEASQEEFEHACDFANMIHDLESKPSIGLNVNDSFIVEDDSFVGLLQSALRHEKMITASIKNIMATARQNMDTLVEKLLIEYLDEQIEEEAELQDILTRIEAFNGNPTSLLIIDKELGEIEE